MADIELPKRPFLYTMDQVATLLNVSEEQLKRQYVHFEGRSIGPHERHHLLARNIAPPNDKPDWRCTERELLRWFKWKGFKYFEKGYLKE